jgi:dipeptide/tripeptide permease
MRYDYAARELEDKRETLSGVLLVSGIAALLFTQLTEMKQLLLATSILLIVAGGLISASFLVLLFGTRADKKQNNKIHLVK